MGTVTAMGVVSVPPGEARGGAGGEHSLSL